MWSAIHLVLLAVAGPAYGQATGPITSTTPPAVSPDSSVVERDPLGIPTIRATQLTTPISLDGRLDEPIYLSTGFVSDFVQQEPFEGRPATERTDVWVFFDAEAVYVSARLWESEPGRRVMSDMQRDARNLYNNDHFGVMFDTFFDRRNGYYFYANAQGGMSDGQLGNESPNSNWNGIWDVRTAEFDGGWTVEFRFPFRSVRFSETGADWGINFRRIVRWKNEASFLTPIPQSVGRRGLTRVSAGGTLTGLQPPQGLRNIDVKPFVTGAMVTNRDSTPAINNRTEGDVGVDAKWGLTQSLVADITVNTDFAQVEDDEAQVNLTRFSVFFPEKREFFLEGQDYFSFGSSGGGGGGGGGGGFGPGNAPILFYSRRIGLAGGQAVPILAGGRLVGRSRGFQLGALHVRTGATEGTGEADPVSVADYSVLRVSRDLLSRSRIGLIATRRGIPDQGTPATNVAVGADLALNLTDQFSASAYWAQTRQDGVSEDATSYRIRADYNSDRYGLEAERLLVGRNFSPEVGFLRRSAFVRSFVQARFSPRLAEGGSVRKLFFEGQGDLFENPSGALESREVQATVRVEFTNTDRVAVEVTDTTEQLDEDLDFDVTIPRGRYQFRQVRASYELAPSRPISGNLAVSRSGFFGGTLTEVSWRGRVEFTSRLYAEPSVSFNRVRTPFGDSDSHVFGTRTTYTLSPRMFVGALMQYRTSSRQLSTNVRFRWEYQPGSELFIVYSDGRAGEDGRRFPSRLQNRTFVLKLTRLFRW